MSRKISKCSENGREEDGLVREKEDITAAIQQKWRRPDLNLSR